MNTILSEFKEEFTESFKNDIHPVITVNDPSIDKVFRNYEYPISSWPVVINDISCLEIKDITERLSQLIRKIPELYFNGEPKKIADFYFRGNQMIAEFALMSCKKGQPTSKRLDLVFSDGTFKVLEVNVGSSIGGWQVQTFENVINKNHPILSKEESKFKTLNSQKLYASFLCKNLVKQLDFKKDNEINIFLSIMQLKGGGALEEQVAFFQNLFKDVQETFGVNITVCSGDPKNLKLNDGKLTYSNRTIQAVLNLDVAELPPDVHRAFFIDSIYFPDNLSTVIYGDKRNLYLLQILADENKFNKADIAFIKKHIPWTTGLEMKQVDFKGNTYNLKELLKTFKNKFIIKPFNGYQGKNIHVGRFESNSNWEEILDSTITSGEYIAQEFCEPEDVYAPNIENKWTPHKLIWGAFDFDNTYCGTWARMTESINDNGIINSATGAIEAIVYQSKII